MKAEGLHLPAEVLNLAVRDPRQPIRDQAGLEFIDLFDQLAGILVAPADRAGFLGQEPPRPAQPFGHRAQAAAVRLVGEPAGQIARRLGQVLGVARYPVLESRVNALTADLDRDHGEQARHHRLVTTHDVAGVDTRHLAGQLRGHGRVAVAIAADPRAPLQEGGHARRPRPAQSRVAGEPVVTATSSTYLRRAIHRPVEGTVDTGDGSEERLVEKGEGSANLIERRRRGPADGRRPPQQADFLTQPAPDLGVVDRAETRIVKLLEQPIAAPQGGQHRAPASFGRVGGQDRNDLKPRHQLFDSIGRPASLAQPVDRRIRRSLERLAARLLSPPELAFDVAFLAQVDELEVEGERDGQRLGLIDLERVEIGREGSTFLLVARLAEGDRAEAATLNEVEQFRPALFGDDLTQQRSEQLDFERERIGRAGRADALRLGLHGRVADRAWAADRRGAPGRRGVASGAGLEESGRSNEGHVPGAYSDRHLNRPGASARDAPCGSLRTYGLCAAHAPYTPARPALPSADGNRSAASPPERRRRPLRRNVTHRPLRRRLRCLPRDRPASAPMGPRRSHGVPPPRDGRDLRSTDPGAPRGRRPPGRRDPRGQRVDRRGGLRRSRGTCPARRPAGRLVAPTLGRPPPDRPRRRRGLPGCQPASRSSGLAGWAAQRGQLPGSSAGRVRGPAKLAIRATPGRTRALLSARPPVSAHAAHPRRPAATGRLRRAVGPARG